jgi:hypothetical protein
MFVIRLIRFVKNVTADFTAELSNRAVCLGRLKKHGWKGILSDWKLLVRCGAPF